MADYGLSLKEKLSYGLGDLASNLCWNILSGFLLFFYTNIALIPVAAAGTLKLLSRVLDALVDPAIGMIVDRTSSAAAWVDQSTKIRLSSLVPLSFICKCWAIVYHNRATLYEEQNPGDFTNVGGTVVPAAQINPTSLSYFKLYPAPNNTANQTLSDGLPTGNYFSSLRRTQNSITADMRIDHHINQNNTLFSNYSYNPVTTFVPGQLPAASEFGKTINSNGGAGFGNVITNLSGPSNTTAQGIAVDYLHIFNPNLVGELKTGFTRVHVATYPQNYGSNLSTDFGVQNAYLGTADTASVPVVMFIGGPYATLGEGLFEPILDINNAYQFRGSLSWSHGNHSFKGGAALIRRQLNYFQDPWAGQGGFAFFGGPGNPMQDFLQSPASFFYPFRGNLVVKLGYRSWEPSFFVQDDWRVMPL